MDEGGRIRFEQSGRVFLPEKADYVPQQVAMIFDNTDHKTIFAEGTTPFPTAHIEKPGKEENYVRDWRTLPLMMVYRPFGGKVGTLDPATIKFTGESAIHANETVFAFNAFAPGVAEALAQDQKPGVVEALAQDQKREGRSRKKTVTSLGPVQLTVWVSPEMDFVPVKYTGTLGGKQIRLLEISYFQDKNHGWVPESWTATLLDREGKIRNSDNVRITKFAINEPVADSEFKPAFPKNTMVMDYINNKRYIERGDGTQREIIDNELQPKLNDLEGLKRNYESILSTKPGELSPKLEPSHGRNWIIGINAVGVLALFAVVMGRRIWRARRSKG